MSLLFISHSASDYLIAEALRNSIDSLLSESDELITISYSSSAERGPQGGDEWRDWIEQQVVEAKMALIVLSRESVSRPWPLWEAAACRGVALQRAYKDEKLIFPRIIALTYGIERDECPDPFLSGQICSGENREDMESVFIQVLEFHGMEAGSVFKAGKKVDKVLDSYLSKVKQALLDAPSLITESIVQDWLSRLKKLTEDQRWSELTSFQRSMNLAFGFDQTTMQRKIDLRLHRRLGEYQLEQRNFREAIVQLRLARESAPRDIHVLSRLSESLLKYILENEEHESIKTMQSEVENLLRRIETLDPDAFYAIPDTAALAAKYHRRILKQPKEAIKIYSKALKLNPNSYYLADGLGQTQIEIGKIDEAKKTYIDTLTILKRIPDHNVWSLATKTTASVVLDNLEAAKLTIDEIIKFKPTQNELISIKAGIQDISDKIGLSETEKESLLSKFRDLV